MSSTKSGAVSEPAQSTDQTVGRGAKVGSSTAAASSWWRAALSCSDLVQKEEVGPLHRIDALAARSDVMGGPIMRWQAASTAIKACFSSSTAHRPAASCSRDRAGDERCGGKTMPDEVRSDNVSRPSPSCHPGPNQARAHFPAASRIPIQSGDLTKLQLSTRSSLSPLFLHVLIN